MKRIMIFICAVWALLMMTACAEEITQDIEKGYWFYETDGLKIEITRQSQEKPALIWYETHIWASEKEPLIAALTDEERPGFQFRNPVQFARNKQFVFAINDDFFGHRLNREKVLGVIVRNNALVSEKTYRNSNHALPNLDTMVFYEDGGMAVYECAELTAQEMLEKGAQQVFAFGPVLVRDGKVNEKVEKYYRNREPRVAFGVVEPYHYVVLVVEGRHKNSLGIDLQWVAEKILEMGAKQALNLDGGQTSVLMFMGEKLNRTGDYQGSTRMRTVSSMIAFGQSESVPPYEK